VIDDFTKSEIDKISHELLMQSKALDVFPTPVDRIVKQANLVISSDVDLSQIQHSFLDIIKEKSKNAFKKGIKKLRGALDRDEKIIYLDLSQLPNRQNFVKLHEVGHEVLKWQNQIVLNLDDDQTLSHETNEQFETEANYFASNTIFQNGRFIKEMERFELGIKAPMQLSKHFGSSVHASLRNYVVQSKNKCALLVLEPIKSSLINEAFCSKRNLFYSNSFLFDIGELELPELFGYTWAFAKDYWFKKRYHEKGKITFLTKAQDKLNANYHFFNNGYNAFVFIFPIGETKKVKTKIYLSEKF